MLAGQKGQKMKQLRDAEFGECVQLLHKTWKHHETKAQQVLTAVYDGDEVVS